MRVAVLTAVAIASTFVVSPPAGAASQTYSIQADGAPPKGEPWAFLRFFPSSTVKVHVGDVLHFSNVGLDTPHTFTLVGDPDANNWRSINQAPGAAYETFVNDSTTGGDDNDTVINPKVGGPTDPTCGTATAPCSWDGTTVLNSGIEFPGATPPTFDVTVNAPVGTYSFLCLLHPEMQAQLKVVPDTTTIPTPQDVSAKGAKQLARAIKVDGKAAEAQSQTVTVSATKASVTYHLNAGGYSNGVTANEFPAGVIKVHVGDKVAFAGTGEIHTATFPKSSFKTVPFIATYCEQTGADTPAQSPADCADPTKFETVFAAKALAPTKARGLTSPTKFLNSGLLVPPGVSTFVAKKPGTYKFICLVHGPVMQGVIKVLA